MYCQKCSCPKSNVYNIERESCRLHTIVNGECIYCGKDYIGKNCRHEWISNIQYYLNLLKNIYTMLKNKFK